MAEHLVSFDLFKRHCMADDLTADDVLLEHYLTAAEAQVVSDTRRTEAELLEAGGGSLPVTLQQAVLLLGAHYYNQREAVAGAALQSVPEAYQALLRPWRKLSGSGGEAATE